MSFKTAITFHGWGRSNDLGLWLSNGAFYHPVIDNDETGRYDFWSRFLLHHSPFLFPLFLGGKRKGEWSSKNRDQKSYLLVSSSTSSFNCTFFVIEKHCTRYELHLLLKSLKIFFLIKLKVFLTIQPNFLLHIWKVIKFQILCHDVCLIDNWTLLFYSVEHSNW